jgi:hypothetical protein
MRWVERIDGIGAIKKCMLKCFSVSQRTFTEEAAWRMWEDNIKMNLRYGVRMCEVD